MANDKRKNNVPPRDVGKIQTIYDKIALPITMLSIDLLVLHRELLLLEKSVLESRTGPPATERIAWIDAQLVIINDAIGDAA